MSTDMIAATALDENRRLCDGWSAQCGASNPSGLIIALQSAVRGCINEGKEAAEDTGIGMVVHQLMYLQRDHFGHMAEAYDAFRTAVKIERAITPMRRSNEELVKQLDAMRGRCQAIRQECGTSFSTNHLRTDTVLTAMTVTLYVCTRADWFDTDGSAYSAAYDKCKTAYEASR